MKTSQTIGKFFVLTFVIVLALGFVLAITETGTDEGTIGVNPGTGGEIIDEDTCGNNIYEPWLEEQCDGGELGGETCSSLDLAYTGELACDSKCVFDTSGCTLVDDGGDTDGGSGGGGSGGGGGSSGGYDDDCIENWDCTEWTECNNNGLQSRTCSDENFCDSTAFKPAEERECDLESSLGINGEPGSNQDGQGLFSRITGAVIGGGTASWLVPLIFILLIIGALVGVSFIKKK